MLRAELSILEGSLEDEIRGPVVYGMSLASRGDGAAEEDALVEGDRGNKVVPYSQV
jgi:hypothetical protein